MNTVATSHSATNGELPTASTLPLATAKAGNVWPVIFLLALTHYVLTANQGPQWQDSGEQQIRMMEGRIEHMHGIALMHPVHFYFGRLAYLFLPLEAGFAITLVSGIAAAIALANLAVLLSWMGVSRLAMLSAVGGLMLAHTFFEHATHTESYMLVAALLTLEWVLLARYFQTGKGKWLAGIFFVNGMGIANHMLATLATPVYGALLLLHLIGRGLARRNAGQQASWWIWLAPLCWLLGMLPLLQLMYVDYSHGHDLVATLRSTAFGTYAHDVVNTRVSLKGLLLAVGFCGYNFPNLLLPLVLVGLSSIRGHSHGKLLWCLFIQLMVYGAFVVRYSIVDQYSYFFVIYLYFCVFAALGFDRACLWMGAVRARALRWMVPVSVALTPVIYLAVAHTLEARGMVRGMVGNKPYRNGYQAFFMPWGYGEDYAQALNDAVQSLVGDDGIAIFEERMTSFALRYQQIEQRLPADVEIEVIGAGPYEAVLLDRIRIALEDGRSVVLVPRDRDVPPSLPGFSLERIGDIYRVLLLSDNPT